MPRRTFMTVAWVAALLLLAAPSARGDAFTLSDPDDSPGGLDISYVKHSHRTVQATGQRLLRHRLTTYEAWDTSVLARGSRIYFFFNIDADADYERRLTINVSEDGTLYAEMDNPSSGWTRGYARVWRPNRRSVAIEFPTRLLKRDLAKYRWYGDTVFHLSEHPDCGDVGNVSVLCGDRAPNVDGDILHASGVHNER